MRTEQEYFWSNSFGDAYTKRNAGLQWRKRIPFWFDVINATGVKSILEVGTNIGTNLKAIREAAPAVVAFGCDVNQTALQEAVDAGLNIVESSVFDLDKWVEPKFEMTATVGMLIHVAPADIERAMRAIIASSKRYVLAVEYEDEKEVEVPYRGYSERLWRRPFGRMYQDLGLKIVSEYDAPAEAFDKCRAWILEKA